MSGQRAPDPNTERLVIKRRGRRVLLILDLVDEAAATETYDRLNADAARDGFVLLEVETERRDKS